MNYSILYISSAVPDLEKEQVDDIMQKSFHNNNNLDISGFLVFNRGNFFQLLEGQEAEVKSIYERIIEDNRHRNLIKMLDQETPRRSFDYYHSGFKICDDPTLVEDLKTYIQTLRKKEDIRDHKTFNLVEGILNSM